MGCVKMKFRYHRMISEFFFAQSDILLYYLNKEDITMSVRYSEDFKKEVVKAYMAGDKSIHQLAVEFNVAKSSVSKWANEYREE